MTNIEQVRLYLRDQVPANGDPRFSDEDITELMKLNNDSVYGATALGWLLKAAELTDAEVSASIGNTSESYGQPTERYKVAMAMHRYWKSKYDDEQGADYAAGLWFELVPDFAEGTGGVVAEIMRHDQWLRDEWTYTGVYST